LSGGRVKEAVKVKMGDTAGVDESKIKTKSKLGSRGLEDKFDGEN
jgi:hypothetical protein